MKSIEMLIQVWRKFFADEFDFDESFFCDEKLSPFEPIQNFSPVESLRRHNRKTPLYSQNGALLLVINFSPLTHFATNSFAGETCRRRITFWRKFLKCSFSIVFCFRYILCYVSQTHHLPIRNLIYLPKLCLLYRLCWKDSSVSERVVWQEVGNHIAC